MLYEKMLKEQEKLSGQIKTMEKQFEKLPAGRLTCAKNGRSYKWYHSEGHIRRYIPKSNRNLAEKLAMKKYYTLKLQDMKKELAAVEAYLGKYKPSVELKELVNNPSEFQNLLSTYLTPADKELSQWMQADYNKNTKYPEQLIHKSLSGNVLRSKSESMIDMCLYLHKIPYRYECDLQLGDLTIYPDFTIRHPKTGKVYFWEHFGLMDNPNYSRNAASKLQLYIQHGIIPSIQLITTYETKDNPLGLDAIERNVQTYFLD